ncbi:hypothetical protein [Kaistia sp. MMO-174]|uniref:hypothetical protein n=1 Tax=Kaistia sp. MMO-174 TaxID=3081256 RepID=UPI0030196A85
MAALTSPRNTPRRDNPQVREPVAAARILQGALVVLEAGAAKPGKTATGLIALGVAEETAEIGDRARTRAGTFRFDNSAAADAIAATEIGKTAYIVDDHTVAKTDGTGTRSAAGTVFDVDAQGVWVKVG